MGIYDTVNMPLGLKAPEIGTEDDASLYDEETEERQLESNVSTIRSATEASQARIEAYRPKPEDSALETSPVLGPAKQSNDLPRNITNFLLEEDMAIWGMKWDKEGFDWNFEVMKQQWSEEPIWSTVTLGFQALTLVAPYARALKIGGTGMKVGRKGSKAAVGIAGAAGLSVPGGIIGALAGGPGGAILGAGLGAAAGAGASKLPLIKRLSEPGFRFYKGIGSRPEKVVESVGLKELSPEAVEKTGNFVRTVNYGDFKFGVEEPVVVPWFSQFSSLSDRGARRAEISMFEDLKVANTPELLKKYGDESVQQIFKNLEDLGDLEGNAARFFLTDEQALDIYMKIPSRAMGTMRRHAQKYNTAARLKAKRDLSKDLASGVAPLTPVEEKVLWFTEKFGNSFFEKTAILTPEDALSDKIGKQLGKWSLPTNIHDIFKSPPSLQVGKTAMHHWIKQDAIRDGAGHLVPDPGPLTGDALRFVGLVEAESAVNQKRGFEAGVFFKGEMEKHPYHVTNVRRHHKVQRGDLDQYSKSTIVPVEDAVTGEIEHQFMMASGVFPRLTDPALLSKRSSWDKTWEAFEKGDLFDTPEEIVLHSLVNDNMLVDNYITAGRVLSDESNIASRKLIDIRYLSKKDGVLPPDWVDVEEIVKGVSAARLKNVLRKRIGDDGEKLEYILGSTDEALQTLPYMRKSSADALFGDQGLFEQTKAVTGWLEAGTAYMKTGATALNPSTHSQNILGNLALLIQAGMNPIAPSSLRLARDLSKNFKKFAIAKREGTEVAWAAGNKKTMIEYKGTKIPFIDLIGYGDDRVKSTIVNDLLVENAFEFVEGFRNLERLYERASKSEHGNLAAFLKLGLDMHDPKKGVLTKDLDGVSKAYRKWVTHSFDNMTGAYLAEDIIPKMMLFTRGINDGLTWQSALHEVGRRLPMYNNIGSAFKGARKYALPWITFPSEAARITKNNLMDNPMGMLPWLRGPQILQSTAYALGLTGDGETYESLEEAKRGLPMWAQQGQETMMTRGKKSRVVTGGAITGTLGAVGGTVAGGPLGAVIGGLAGGVAGAAASYFLDRDGEEVRGAVLNWLPHSSVAMSEARAPDFHFTKWKDVIDIAPAEPFAIARPLLETFFGKNEYGDDAFTGGFGDSIKKTIAGYIGFLAPPLIQRFGYNSATPDVALFGNEWTGGAIAAAAGGAMALALSKKAGVPLISGIKTASKAAALGAVAGSTADVSRLYTDTGIRKDIYGRQANPAQDALLTVFGVARNYPSRPETQIGNEGVFDRHIQEVRSYIGRQVGFHSANGMDEALLKDLKDVQVTFKAQYNDASLAQRRYQDWLEQYLSSIGTHPALRGMSQEEILQRLYKASAFADETRGQAQQEMFNMLVRIRSENIQRAAARRGKKS